MIDVDTISLLCMILYMGGEYVFLFFLVMLTCLPRINICMWHRDDNGKKMFSCFVERLDRAESARQSSLDITAVDLATRISVHPSLSLAPSSCSYSRLFTQDPSNHFVKTGIIVVDDELSMVVAHCLRTFLLFK